MYLRLLKPHAPEPIPEARVGAKAVQPVAAERGNLSLISEDGRARSQYGQARLGEPLGESSSGTFPRFDESPTGSQGSSPSAR